MDPVRRARLQAQIHEDLTVLIRREVSDPRIQDIFITKVELPEDASVAKVSIVIERSLEPRTEAVEAQMMKEAIQGLSSASGFLRKMLSSSIQVRHIPSLVFREDRGYHNTERVNELLRQLEKDKSGNDSQ
jgi:ribosome-binding factor A